MDDGVIVVGGGIAGLAAAALLARDGHAVQVLERRSEAGGRAATRELEGFALTEGAHALYLGGPGMPLLRGLGIDPPGGVPDAAHGAVLRDGVLHPSPFGHVQLPLSRLLSLRERAAAGRLLLTLGRRDPRHAAGTSAEAWIEAQHPSPRVRGLLRALVRLATYSHALDRLSGEMAALQLRITLRDDVRYLDGGWASLVRALRTAAERSGAVVRCSVTVAAVEPGPVVRLDDGTALPARAVVLAGLAPAAVERLTGARLPDTGPPVEAACLDVALRALPRPDRPWTLGIDEPLYVSAYSAVSKVAPEGAAVVHVVRHLADGESPGREQLEDALDRVQPGWRDELVHASFLPRMTAVHAAPGPREGLEARPGTGALGLPGVHLAGDWVGSEGWLADAALASAAAAARAVAAERARPEVPAAA